MPAFFIPARNSRHRTACFALYRALLQQATLIRLPDDLATVRGPINPIKHLIRRAFRRNRTDTSPRLIFPALKAGYRILALLKSAASSSPSSPNADHTSITTFLRARLDERNRSLSAQALHPPHSRNPPQRDTAPRPGTIPLLVKVSPAPTPTNPNPKPKYATPSRPRPQSELGGTGRRKVPHLDLASDFPFLRVGKPQPPLLNRVLTQKTRRRVARTGFVQTLAEEMIPNAELEDEWEKSMRTVLQRQGGGGHRDSVPRGGVMSVESREAMAITEELRAGNTFRNTVWIHGLAYVQDLLSREQEDLVARADAMRRLVEEETKLAKEEKVQRDIDRRKRWEAKMLGLHGEGWRELFPNHKEDVGSPA
ncbi:hypothetical protein GGR54DRAFT_587031 [Hypoxylon sp. NC1633]|nr:hypothetical protein GGR54DRAFT_587031 [Hypoxylon sp. NC1633]